MNTVYLDESDSLDLYTEAVSDANSWREDYPEYERLMNNGLLEGFDDSLPEVNDGSLAAALFKLPKRIVSGQLGGRVKALDRDEAWLTELANIQWENEIIPHANFQAPFHRKWKDAVRKSAGYGSVPIITIFRDDGFYRGADFIVVQPQDVKLEPGKVSDSDSDVVYWDVYYTKLQLKNIIAQAKEENKEAKADGRDNYNKWRVKELENLLAGDNQEERSTQESSTMADGKSVKKSGYKFTIVFQRGVDAPFRMMHTTSKTCVREWSNPDPTGDIPVHYLYCYQDFVNPYGIGICRLAGGTQNVLDFMRQQDVLATSIGIRPPLAVSGDADGLDIDSVVWQQDAMWFLGNAQVEKQDISSQVYQQLPDRVGMYKTSLNQILPMGDTTIAGGSSGDPNTSKTPAGVKFAASNLSIDDEDFKNNFYDCFSAVSKSMINTHFANMTGSDLMKLDDNEREVLTKAGLKFPVDEMGEPTNQLDIIWDNSRATFDFEVDPNADKTKDDEVQLQGLQTIAELRADPAKQQAMDMALQTSGKRFNDGELYTDMVSLLSDNDKIIDDISPEDQAQMQQEQEMAAAQGIDPTTGQPLQDPSQQGMEPEMEQPQLPPELAQEMPPEELLADPVDDVPPEVPLLGDSLESGADEQQAVDIMAVMDEYNVDEETAIQMLMAEEYGIEPEEIMAYIQGQQGVPQ